MDNPAQPEQSAQLPQQLAPQPAAAQEGETLPSRAPQTDITQPVPLPDDIRLQIEKEQALADAQKRVRELEEQVGKLSTEKEGVVGERDGACRFLFILYSCARQVKSRLITILISGCIKSAPHAAFKSSIIPSQNHFRTFSVADTFRLDRKGKEGII